MRKNLKRLALMMLAGVLVLSLTGCKRELTVQDQLQKAVEMSAQAKSYDMTTNMSFVMGMSGMSMDFKSVTDATYFTDPMKMKSNTMVDMGILGSQSTEQYMVVSDDTITTYTKDSAVGEWTRQDVAADMSTLQQYSLNTGMQLYSTGSFIIAGTEDIGGVKTNKLEGTLSGADMEGYMDQFMGLMNMQELMQDESAEQMLDAMLSNMGDMQMVMWVDAETYMPVKYSMDMTEMMTGMMQALGEQMPSLAGLEISDVIIEMEISNVNQAADFELPANLPQ